MLRDRHVKDSFEWFSDEASIYVARNVGFFNLDVRRASARLPVYAILMDENGLVNKAWRLREAGQVERTGRREAMRHAPGSRLSSVL
ncbi:hypothetical protein [Cohnella rhizosphaerae]|uniref:Uncharacterized protein n=1 Tax=Cohnella rhizosphaerae TaxID=1457232 RepID=A0A9X4QVR4_9BACL|nr:hypothetical protein [Cohnella rhizosphaerae]MDG0812849.1 hypothetical protein [Cohnella rhizosphaerae]